jgi:hypothetical protein
MTSPALWSGRPAGPGRAEAIHALEGPSVRLPIVTFRWKSSAFLAAFVLLALRAESQGVPEYGDLKVATHWIAEAPVGDSGEAVTDDLLLGAADNRSAWLHYYGDYRGFRHSAVPGLTPEAAKGLRPRWVLPTGTAGHLALSPRRGSPPREAHPRGRSRSRARPRTLHRPGPRPTRRPDRPWRGVHDASCLGRRRCAQSSGESGQLRVYPS